jgi:hypothetical protein
MTTRTIRLSQTLSPFGVGAIYDFRGESLVACDISRWGGRGHRIRSDRLERALNVQQLKTAPSQVSLWGTAPPIPYFRFPQWLFCPRCRRMVRWSTKDEVSGEQACCSERHKRTQLVPMRFVMVCENGHLSDVPWDYWAHSEAATQNQKQCRSKALEFVSVSGAGGGLGSLVVRCTTCKAKRNLAGIAGKDALKALGIRCEGRQPWQFPDQAVACGEVPQALQRGASNVYFAHTESALEIPPESHRDAQSDASICVTNNPNFSALLAGGLDGPIAPYLIRLIADDCHCGEDDVTRIAADEIRARGGRVSRPTSSGMEGSSRDATQDLRAEEWTAFTTCDPLQDDDDTFVTRDVGVLPDQSGDRRLSPVAVEFARRIDKVVLALRLREVRALKGFSRYRYSEERMLSSSLGFELTPSWLPAIEVFGEGVFVALDETALRAWESLREVKERAHVLESRQQDSEFGKRLPAATPRFLLLHTLAHLLIRELAARCGYGSASLRERIYSSAPGAELAMAGILVYTAAGDVEGTLGGLVRQGEPPRFAETLAGALLSASWCSTDPLCSESGGQGMGSLNLASCHACTLVSETSCEFSNTLLDRSLVVGGGGCEQPFFAEALRLARQSGVSEVSEA